MNDMDVQDYIEIIVDNGDIQSMCELSYMLEDAMEDVKRNDEKRYRAYALKLYKLAYGEKLNRDLAEDIVSKMRPYGLRWTLEEVRELQNRYGFKDINATDMFVVINSAYNDYRDIFGDNVEMYLKYAVDFIKDEDAGEGKVFKYFTTIPRMED